jgi:short-subunit dehydrogenase
MIIWITGASSGIGKEVARQYAQAGHTVCISARSSESLAAVAQEYAGLPGQIHVFPIDVTDIAAVESAYTQMCEQVGLPDLSILNAGTHKENPVAEFDRELYSRIMDINYMGVVNCMQALVPGCVERRNGHIAVVSSVAGYRGLPKASAYGASKAALINMCEALQPELAAYNVKLRLINPGFVRTPLTDLNEFDMPFIMEVEDAARRMISKLEGNYFEITFPRRFTFILKVLRMLPYGLYLRMTRNLLKQ